MDDTRRSGTLVALATLIAPISWGTTYITITELLPAGRPLLVAALRVAPAAIVLLLVGMLKSRWRPHGAEWGRIGILAMLNFGIFFPLLVVAAYRLPGGVAAAAGGLQPLLVAVLTWIIVGTHPRRIDVAVGVVAAVGVGLVVIRPGAGFDTLGLVAAIVANLSFAAGVVYTKRFPVTANRVASTGWQMLIGAAVLVPLALLVEGAPPALTPRSMVGFAYLGLVGTAVAFLLWFNGVRRLPVQAPPLLGLAAPITGAVAGWVVLSESLSAAQIVGFAVTVGAITYGATMADRPSHETLAPLGAPPAAVGSSVTDRGADPGQSPVGQAPVMQAAHEPSERPTPTIDPAVCPASGSSS